jgi:hypothetical protein
LSKRSCAASAIVVCGVTLITCRVMMSATLIANLLLSQAAFSPF